MAPVDTSTPLPGGFVDSEVGTLREVILHRPGAELRRLTPRNNDRLLFDGLPWVDRAQDEHDAFAETLRGRGVLVHLVTDLLREVLGSDDVRAQAIEDVVTDGSPSHLRLGDTLRATVRAYLQDLDADGLTDALVAGVRGDELPGRSGLVAAMLAHDDFVVDPLPNLLFTRDSSVWIGDEVAVASLAMPARDRETHLLGLVYAHHPRFSGVVTAYEPSWEHVEGGDVLVVGPGRAGRRGPANGPRRPAWSGSPARPSAAAWHTPCWRCRSPRSGPPCTWTPSAPWSTATPSSSTPTSRRAWWRSPSRRRAGPVGAATCTSRQPRSS
jgi:arginine deiminase